MDVDEYEDKFFETAEEMGHKIEICKGGPSRGGRQIDFGNKKLHAGHVRKLYPLIRKKGLPISYEGFNELVPGRPCAVPYFNDINKRMFDKIKE